MSDMAIAALEAVMIDGDLSKLSAPERLLWYRTRCEIAGLDPRAQPFQYINLNGRLTLYATKAATDQIAGKRHISVDLLRRELLPGEIFLTEVRARDASGRTSDDVGAVSVGGLKGEALANAIKKAVTQGKRRAVLSFCGLGALYETEIDSVPGARRVQVNEHGEVMGELPGAGAHEVGGPEPDPDEDSEGARTHASHRIFGIAKGKGLDTTDMPAMRRLAGKALARDVPQLRDLTAKERNQVADWLNAQPAREETESEAWRAAQAAEEPAEEPEPERPSAADAVPQTAPGWKERAAKAMETKTFAQQAGLG